MSTIRLEIQQIFHKYYAKRRIIFGVILWTYLLIKSKFPFKNKVCEVGDPTLRHKRFIGVIELNFVCALRIPNQFSGNSSETHKFSTHSTTYWFFSICIQVHTVT